jgi:hypothetical protein
LSPDERIVPLDLRADLQAVAAKHGLKSLPIVEYISEFAGYSSPGCSITERRRHNAQSGLAALLLQKIEALRTELDGLAAAAGAVTGGSAVPDDLLREMHEAAVAREESPDALKMRIAA